MAFKPAVNSKAYLKAGILGLQGSGKTRTASEVAIGLHAILQKGAYPGGKSPVFFLDTETGAPWVAPLFDQAGIELQVDATRAFPDLVAGIRRAASESAILIIDSITHFWVDLTESYASERGRRKLEFHDWATLKGIWREFTDLFVNAPCHIEMLGRQGYEYDFYVDDDGKKQIEKSAVKMKAEAETGYEPDLLIMMERHQEVVSGHVEKVWRTALVLKDRSSVIDGQTFDNPTFESFLPHINRLNLGGAHIGVDAGRTSSSVIPRSDQSYRHEEQLVKIELEEILELIKKHHPSQSVEDKQARANLAELVFGTRSWTKVETLGLIELKAGRNHLLEIFEERAASTPAMQVVSEPEPEKPKRGKKTVKDEIPF